MNKYIGMFIVVAALCGSGFADVVTSGTFTGGTTSFDGVSDDLFQNASITANTAAHPVRNIADIFSQGSPVVAEDMIFDDGNGTLLSFVDFNISSAVNLTNITIGLRNDPTTNPLTNKGRAITNVKLYAASASGAVLDGLIANVDVDPDYKTAYGGDRNLELVIENLTASNVQFFRLEFTEFNPGSNAGARVVEVDGFGSVIPEPAVLALMVFVGGLLFGIRRIIG